MIPVAFAATRKMVEPVSEKYSRYLRVGRDVYEETSRRIMSALKGGGMTTREIKEALETRVTVSPIVNLMCDKGLFIRGNPKGDGKTIFTHTIFSVNIFQA